ncbi:MAG: hypothetical protein LBH28_08130 [Oscillospiraceae bacterium]|jgi:hypothetical protein|nr:hypothetical protein [Oscillospiraceae bacterium]
MPDKQNDNKFMAMLERKGIVRKADSENDPAETVPDEIDEKPEMDLRSMFGQIPDDSSEVAQAARQPIPVMPDPVVPDDLPRDVERKQHEPVRRAEPESPDKITPQREIRFSPESAQRDDVSVSTRKDASNGDVFRQHVDNYTDAYMDIDDLYNVLSLKSKKTETIYLVEEYLRTLPDSLPDESRREIISKLVAVSGFDYELLIGDGVLRVKMLKEYAERFARQTDDYVFARQSEIEELEKHVSKINELIESRRELHKRQFYVIESEAQRLKDILTFITG